MDEAGPAVATEPTRQVADGRLLTLTHDFGAIRPAVLRTHAFTVHNPTAIAWTLDQVRTSCGCAVGDISTEVVSPGGSAEVVFSYKPPTEPSDDRRAIDVLFKEPAAPLVKLVVAAKVRHPLTAFPLRLQLARLPHGKPHVERVTVENYSGESLPAPRLVASHDWLTVGEPESLPANEPGMTGRWAVPLTVAADRLTPGDHSAEVTAAPGQPHGDKLRLPVSVQVVPPLDPTPSQLFFGTATVGKPTTITFAVRLPATIAADSLTLSHDLGPQLVMAHTATEPGRANFTATLTPTIAGMVRGTVGVRCGDTTIPETKLAVMGRALADAP